MVTSNSNTGDSRLFDFTSKSIVAKNPTGTLPIATSMDPRWTRYYVSNYLGQSISVMCGPEGVPLTCDGVQLGQKIVDINLRQNYNPVNGAVGGNGAIGGLPIDVRHLPSQDQTHPSMRSQVDVCRQHREPIDSLKLGFPQPARARCGSYYPLYLSSSCTT